MMARTQIVIGYSFGQGVRRTTVIPDDDSQVPTYVAWLASMGEQVLVGTLTDYRFLGPDAMLARFLGRQPTTDRCAIVNAAGYVVGVIRADPTMDRHPLGRLHRDPQMKAVPGQLASGLGLLA